MLRRNISDHVREALLARPGVLVNGARQTGKTTLVQSLVAAGHQATYVSLDEAPAHAAAYTDPAGFLSRFEGPVILDEIQRAPELFLAIKVQVDRGRLPGRFLLTGSSDILLLPRLADALPGRMEILTLWPLSQGEIEGVREGLIDILFSDQMPVLPRGRAGGGGLRGGESAGRAPPARGLVRLLPHDDPPARCPRRLQRRRAHRASTPAGLARRPRRHPAERRGGIQQQRPALENAQALHGAAAGRFPRPDRSRMVRRAGGTTAQAPEAAGRGFRPHGVSSRGRCGAARRGPGPPRRLARGLRGYGGVGGGPLGAEPAPAR